ncbi:MAG: hypothetical protein ACLT2T_16530 [Bilophila wadsworthia]
MAVRKNGCRAFRHTDASRTPAKPAKRKEAPDAAVLAPNKKAAPEDAS